MWSGGSTAAYIASSGYVTVHAPIWKFSVFWPRTEIELATLGVRFGTSCSRICGGSSMIKIACGVVVTSLVTMPGDGFPTSLQLSFRGSPEVYKSSLVRVRTIGVRRGHRFWNLLFRAWRRGNDCLRDARFRFSKSFSMTSEVYSLLHIKRRVKFHGEFHLHFLSPLHDTSTINFATPCRHSFLRHPEYKWRVEGVI